MRDGVEYTERHHAASSWGIGRDQQAVELIGLPDKLGHQQVISEPYYASPSLLRAGLQEYSFEAGFTRDNYGITSNDYGRPLIVGTDKVGLTNELTPKFTAKYCATNRHWASPARCSCLISVS